MSAPRGLSAEEAAAWEKVAATTVPLHPLKPVQPRPAHEAKAPARPAPPKKASLPRAPKPARIAPPPPTRPTQPDRGLDSHWDRRLKSGALQPELTLDLHGHNLDAAYDRLMSGVAQARAMGARTILLITGKPRPVASADRSARD